MSFLHVFNAAVIAYNLIVLLPGVWRYGFDWKLLALVCGAITFAITSSVLLIVMGAAS